MKQFTAVIERDADTGVYVGWIPGFPGAHSQGDSLDELRANLHEVVEMLLADGGDWNLMVNKSGLYSPPRDRASTTPATAMPATSSAVSRPVS